MVDVLKLCIFLNRTFFKFFRKASNDPYLGCYYSRKIEHSDISDKDVFRIKKAIKYDLDDDPFDFFLSLSLSVSQLVQTVVKHYI